MTIKRKACIRAIGQLRLFQLSIQMSMIIWLLPGIATQVPAWAKVALHVDSWIGCPTWSPDGTKVAVSVEGSKSKIILDTRNDLRLATDIGFYQVWSPDSKLVACECALPDTGEVKVGIFDTVTCKWLMELKLPEDQFCISWSPDSKKLAVARQVIKIMDLRTLTSRTIGPVNARRRQWHVAKWSPEGDLLACSDGTSIDIFKSNLLTESPRIIKTAHFTGLPGDLVWSMKGEFLAYSSPGRITVLDANNFQEKYRIDIIQTSPVGLQRSPDGTKFAFLDSGKLHVRTFSQAIENLQITAPSNIRGQFSWSPNGKYFLISSSGQSGIFLAESGRALGITTLKGSTSGWLPTSDGIVLCGNHNRILPLPNDSGGLKTSGQWNLASPKWAHVPNPKNMKECFQLLDANLRASSKTKIKNRKRDDLSDFGGGCIILDGCIAKLWSEWGTGYIQRECRKFGIYEQNGVLAYVVKKYWMHLAKQSVQKLKT